MVVITFILNILLNKIFWFASKSNRAPGSSQSLINRIGHSVFAHVWKKWKKGNFDHGQN